MQPGRQRIHVLSGVYYFQKIAIFRFVFNFFHNFKVMTIFYILIVIKQLITGTTRRLHTRHGHLWAEESFHLNKRLVDQMTSGHSTPTVRIVQFRSRMPPLTAFSTGSNWKICAFPRLPYALSGSGLIHLPCFLISDLTMRGIFVLSAEKRTTCTKLQQLKRD